MIRERGLPLNGYTNNKSVLSWNSSLEDRLPSMYKHVCSIPTLQKIKKNITAQGYRRGINSMLWSRPQILLESG